VTYKGVPVFVYGRGDLGRSPVYTQTDLNFTQSISLPRNMRLNVQFNIDNLFDQMTETGKAVAQYRDALVLSSDAEFFGGFDTVSKMATRSPVGRPNATYNQASSFQGARSARISLKLTF